MNRERLINDVADALAAHDRTWPALVVAAGLREEEAEAVATAAFGRLSPADQSWWLAPCDFDSTIADDAATLLRFLTQGPQPEPRCPHSFCSMCWPGAPCRGEDCHVCFPRSG